MAAMTLACTNLVQASSHSTWDYTTTEEGYAGFAGGVRYDVTILRFEVPAIAGTSKGLSAGIVVRSGPVSGNLKFRYAVCTSDANREKYRSTTAAVSDANQIKTGTITLSSVSNTAAKKSFSIDVEMTGGKTYYLMLWAYESTGVFVSAVSAGHSVTVSYDGGVVRVKVNGVVKPYMVFVKVSGSLKQMIPYVKTASGIKPGG